MILVTGASGLLGVSLITSVRSLGREVAGLSHRHGLRIPEVRWFRLDLTDLPATRKLIEDLHPAAVIHCAAATNVDWCEEHRQEAERMNVAASAVLAEAANACGAKFLYISTDSVFDGVKGRFSENDAPSPLNIYARSKLHGEQAVAQHHPSVLIARVNIYGWNAQSKYSLSEWALSQLMAGKEVPGFTDVYFSPILANDLTETLLAMLDQDLSGVYHVVGSERTSKYEFARRLAVIFGLDPSLVKSVSIHDAGLRAPRPQDISLSTEKVCRDLGRRMPDVEAGLWKFRDLQRSGYPQQIKSYLAGAAK